MPLLVTLAEQKTYLGDAPASADDALITALIDDVEALFASEAGRGTVAFQAAAAGRVEFHDATGAAHLYLDYPVAALTSVSLGWNTAAFDETLTIADPTVIVYTVGGRRITRTDGGTFGRAGHLKYVRVVYDAAADLPAGAKLAIKSVVAQAYRRRGSEAEKSETLGSFYSRTLVDDVAGADPYWRTAVAANARGQLV